MAERKQIRIHLKTEIIEFDKVDRVAMEGADLIIHYGNQQTRFNGFHWTHYDLRVADIEENEDG